MYVAIGTVLPGWGLAKQAQQERRASPRYARVWLACRSVGLELLRPYFPGHAG